MILGSTQQLFSHQYDGFDTPYPSSFRVCAARITWNAKKFDLSGAGAGRQELNIAAVEFAGW